MDCPKCCAHQMCCAFDHITVIVKHMKSYLIFSTFVKFLRLVTLIT